MATYSLSGFVAVLYTSTGPTAIYSYDSGEAELILSGDDTPVDIVLPNYEDDAVLPYLSGDFYAGELRQDILGTGEENFNALSARSTTRLVTWEDGSQSTVLFLALTPRPAVHLKFAFVIDGSELPYADYVDEPWRLYELEYEHEGAAPSIGEFAAGNTLSFSDLETVEVVTPDLPEVFEWGTDEHDFIRGSFVDDLIFGGLGPDRIFGGEGNDQLFGARDVPTGHEDWGWGDNLWGEAGDDTLIGSSFRDDLDGGAGDDVIYGSVAGDTDEGDGLFGRTGNDFLNGMAGDDSLYGGEGQDTLIGAEGGDLLVGQDGDDLLAGGAWGDVLFGGAGDDFLNGGWGHDRLNGGDGADRFFHALVEGHGADWIQDYSHVEGDKLVSVDGTDVSDFQVNFAETSGAGASGVEEAFVIYKPTGQILWALVDGAEQDSIFLTIDEVTYDLL